MLAKLLLVFTVVPLAEVFLLYALGQLLGFWPTVALVLVTGVLGAALAKREGLRVLRSWRDSLAAGQMPEEGILGGVLVLVGGVLLITPGVLTDLFGVALLVPASRRWVAAIVRKRLEKSIAEGRTTFRYRVDLGGGRVVEHVRAHEAGDVVDTEGEVLEERRTTQALEE